MKTKLLITLLFLIATSTQTLAGEARLNGKKLDVLTDALVVCPSNTRTRFVDNGDGTICDRRTGLMWEQKNDLVGSFTNNPGHVSNLYTWSSSSTGGAADGSVFTDFLPRLNGVIAGTVASEQLGGHSDWRLPTSAELQTILDCSFGVPCIHPVFVSATDSVPPYWSFTSTTIPSDVWVVNFISGDVHDINKNFPLHVRAVRGGW